MYYVQYSYTKSNTKSNTIFTHMYIYRNITSSPKIKKCEDDNVMQKMRKYLESSVYTPYIFVALHLTSIDDIVGKTNQN